MILHWERWKSTLAGCGFILLALFVGPKLPGSWEGMGTGIIVAGLMAAFDGVSRSKVEGVIRLLWATVLIYHTYLLATSPLIRGAQVFWAVELGLITAVVGPAMSRKFRKSGYALAIALLWALLIGYGLDSKRDPFNLLVLMGTPLIGLTWFFTYWAKTGLMPEVLQNGYDKFLLKFPEETTLTLLMESHAETARTIS